MFDRVLNTPLQYSTSITRVLETTDIEVHRPEMGCRGETFTFVNEKKTLP